MMLVRTVVLMFSILIAKPPWNECKNIYRLRPYFDNLDSIPLWMEARLNASGQSALLNDPELLTGSQRTTTISQIWCWITSCNSGETTGGTTGGSTGGSTGAGGASGEVSIEGSSEDVPIKTCDCSCGAANSRLRIVGGQETRVNQYPWMAMLMYDGRFYCGATLINELYVLTAAHCVEGFTARRIKVRLLDHDRNVAGESSPLNRGVRTAIVHHKYNQNTFNNDIALLKLDQEVPFHATLQPACLPDKGKRYTGANGLVTGWGKVAENKPVSPVLREVTVPILSNAKCSSFYGSSQITDNMMCAGYKEGGKDSCQGDSGGPLHVKNGTYHQIVGVVSWGEGCARPNNPGVYARVNRYLTWIAANTAGTCFCSPSSTTI